MCINYQLYVRSFWLSLNVAQGQKYEKPSETQTHKQWSTRISLLLAIGLMSRVFANGPGDWDSIPGWVIPKTQKMVLDATLLGTQPCKARIEGKVEQSQEWSSALSYTLVS